MLPRAVRASRESAPGAGLVRDALFRPVLDRLEQGLLDEFLGQVEIAQRPDQRRGQPAGFLAEDGGQRGVGRGLVLCYRGDSPRSTTGRTSTSPPVGHRFAISMASSRSATVTSA